jgi:hypothetical protein
MNIVIDMGLDEHDQAVLNGIYTDQEGHSLHAYVRNHSQGGVRPADITYSLRLFEESLTGVAVYSVPVIDVMAWRLHDQSVQEHLVDLAIRAATDQGLVTERNQDRAVVQVYLDLAAASYVCCLEFEDAPSTAGGPQLSAL